MPDVEPGYIYALINHSMPGVVRVGMTTRSPEERAVELSPPTGAPFIVAFDVLLHDAAAGEAMLLERLGDGTEGESREFFETPLREVIRSMLIIRDQMASSGMLRSAPTVPDPAPAEVIQLSPSPRSAIAPK